MRLLAYGGTSYDERNRIGLWPRIPRGALEDNYSLPEGAFIYGLGLLEDKQPFLILRQMQMIESGRSYAFTLLLDPGRALWERFEWNAAAFAQALLTAPDGLAERLLREPEVFTEEALARSLEGVEPARITPQADAGGNDDDLLACWVGACFAQDAYAVSPTEFGFAARPLPAEVAARVVRLPLCFRNSAGWLVGGSRENGQAYGSRLVLDKEARNGAAVAASDLIAQGRRVLALWATVVADDEFVGAVESLSARPWWEWPETGEGDSPAERIERLALLAELLRPTQPVDDLLDALDERLRGSSLLEAEIRRAAQRLALAGTERLSRRRTTFILSNHFAHGAHLDDALVARLDRKSLIESFVKLELSPNDTALRLAPDIRCEIWRGLIGAAPSYPAVPALLRAALDDLEREARSATEKIAQQFSLIEEARVRIELSSESLRVWDGFPRAHALWPQVARVLRDEALRHAQFQRDDWERDYLLYGQDAGGKTLAGMGLEPQAIGVLVGFCLNAARSGGSLSQPAAEWLTALAASPLRRQIGIRSKVAIVKEFRAGWENLAEMWALYRNQEAGGWPHTRLTRGAAYERDALFDELREMIAVFPPTEVVPNLQGLFEFLGGLPEDVVASLARLRPRLTAQTAAGWVGGWRKLRQQKQAEQEMVRLLTESAGALPEGWLVRGFDEASLEVLFDRLLFRGRPEKNEQLRAQQDEQMRARLEEILRQESGHTRLSKAAWRVFQAGETDQFNRATFMRRYADHPGALNTLLECFSLPRQDQIIRLLAHEDAERFADAACRVYRAARNGKSINAYEHAVLRYLHLPQGERLKKKVAVLAHGPMAYLRSSIDEQLERLLRLAKEMPAPPATESAAEEEYAAEEEDAAEDSAVEERRAASAAEDEEPSAGGWIKKMLKSSFQSIFGEDEEPAEASPAANMRREGSVDKSAASPDKYANEGARVEASPELEMNGALYASSAPEPADGLRASDGQTDSAAPAKGDARSTADS